ncbi:MAG: carbon-nitrogen hydrolase family protein [Desulfopila sp.]
MKTEPTYTVAAVQAAPVYLDLQKSTEKACVLIREAAENGARLIAFPEAFLPGYPWWIFHGDPFNYGMKYWIDFYKNSVEIPGNTIMMLSNAARDNDIYVSISVTEKEGGSLYLSQLWFDNEGALIGKHRKIRPTAGERTIWAEGDGSMMPVFATRIGRLGGLQCWEHRMPTNLLVMAAQNEQVHVAAWPTGIGVDDHLFSAANNVGASTYYAATTGTFVLMASQIFTEEMKEKLGNIEQNLGQGHAGIINPNGYVISESLPHDQEGLVFGKIDLEQIITSKYLLDPAGHYAKGSVSQLYFNQNSQKAVIELGAQTFAKLTNRHLTEAVQADDSTERM